MDLVRLPSLLPLLALFSGEESRVVVVKKLLEKLTTVEEVVEDKVTIGGIIFLFLFQGQVLSCQYSCILRCAWEPCKDSGRVCLCFDKPGTLQGYRNREPSLSVLIICNYPISSLGRGEADLLFDHPCHSPLFPPS